MSYASSLKWIIVATVVISGAGFAVYLYFKPRYRVNRASLFGAFFGMVTAVLVVHSILYFSSNPTEIYSELSALSGAGLGWLIGMWLSPLGTREGTKFSSYWTAIGVGSGFTLKWGLDHIVEHTAWLTSHASISLIFFVALLITTAAVYSSRAYEDSLTIAPRVPLADSTAMKGEIVVVKAGAVAVFYAATTGPNDPMTRWSVIPGTLGRIDDLGVFTAFANSGAGRITAFNVEDPTLSGCIQVEVSVGL